jgi:hypothetical protein
MKFLLEYSIFRRTSQDHLFINPDSFIKIKKIIEKECKPFLELMVEKNLKPLLRGAHKIDPEKAVITGLYKKKSRINRKPKDMPTDIQELFDNFFIDKFGWPARSSGVFTTFSDKITYGYGNEDFIVLPIGEFNYIWNPNIEDLFTYIEDYNYLYEPDDEILEEEYWSINDENSGLGIFYYDNINTGKKKYQEVIDMYSKDEDFDEELIEWVPDKSLKSFIKEIREEREDFFSEIFQGYIDTDIEKATNHEIILKCDEYYLLSSSYYKDFTEYIQSITNN